MYFLVALMMAFGMYASYQFGKYEGSMEAFEIIKKELEKKLL